MKRFSFVALLAASAFFTGCQPKAEEGPREPDAALGAIMIRKYGCGTCHVIPGIPGAGGKVGPSLKGVAGRRELAGALVHTPENLARWIRFPRTVKPRTAMPTLGVSENEARDIIAFLYEHSGGTPPPPSSDTPAPSPASPGEAGVSPAAPAGS